MSTLDLSRPLCTRSGMSVMLIAVLPDNLPLENNERIIGLIDWGEPGEPMYELNSWRIDGTFNANSAPCNLDLINAPASVTVKRIKTVVGA